MFCYIKENHGNIFRKVSFSNMLEPYVRLNQQKNAKQMKLKKLEKKLNEIKNYKNVLENYKINQDKGDYQYELSKQTL